MPVAWVASQVQRSTVHLWVVTLIGSVLALIWGETAPKSTFAWLAVKLQDEAQLVLSWQTVPVIGRGWVP